MSLRGISHFGRSRQFVATNRFRVDRIKFNSGFFVNQSISQCVYFRNKPITHTHTHHTHTHTHTEREREREREREKERERKKERNDGQRLLKL